MHNTYVKKTHLLQKRNVLRTCNRLEMTHFRCKMPQEFVTHFRCILYCCGAPGKLFRCFELAQLTEGGLGRSKSATNLIESTVTHYEEDSTIFKPY